MLEGRLWIANIESKATKIEQKMGSLISKTVKAFE